MRHKNVNTKHRDRFSDATKSIDCENISQFILRLYFEKHSREYKKYFKDNDFKDENQFIEKLVEVYGQDFILDFEESIKWSPSETVLALFCEVRCSNCDFIFNFIV